MNARCNTGLFGTIIQLISAPDHLSRCSAYFRCSVCISGGEPNGHLRHHPHSVQQLMELQLRSLWDANSTSADQASQEAFFSCFYSYFSHFFHIYFTITCFCSYSRVFLFVFYGIGMCSSTRVIFPPFYITYNCCGIHPYLECHRAYFVSCSNSPPRTTPQHIFGSHNVSAEDRPL